MPVGVGRERGSEVEGKGGVSEPVTVETRQPLVVVRQGVAPATTHSLQRCSILLSLGRASLKRKRKPDAAASHLSLWKERGASLFSFSIPPFLPSLSLFAKNKERDDVGSLVATKSSL